MSVLSLDDFRCTRQGLTPSMGKIQRSSDLTQIINLRVAIIYVVIAPLASCLSAYFLFRLLGRAAFVAVALTVIQLPIPAKLTMLTLGVQKASCPSSYLLRT